MARVTIEDSLKNVDNVYQLIFLASKRAAQLQNGSPPKIKVRDPYSKPTVIALREIAAGFVDMESPEEVEDASDNG